MVCWIISCKLGYVLSNDIKYFFDVYFCLLIRFVPCTRDC